MFFVEALTFSLFIVHLEGHKIEERDTVVPYDQVVGLVNGLKTENDEKMRRLESRFDARIQQLSNAWTTENNAKVVRLEANIHDLINMNNDLKQTVRRGLLPPLGLIYIQYGQQEEPERLWPGATWTNVSPQYTGAFFPAEGGCSYRFGQFQEESMRIIHFHFLNYDTGYIGMDLQNDHDAKINVGGNGGQTVGLHVAYDQKDKPYLQRYNNNEVRPYNQAIRIWKRTA